MDDSNEDNSSDEEDEGSKEGGKTIAIEGMGILTGKDGKSKASKPGTMEDNKVMEDAESRDSKEKVEEDQDDNNKEIERVGAGLAKRMAEASEDLIDTPEEGTYDTPLDPHTDDEEGETYKQNNSSVKPGDNNLNMTEYDSNAWERSSGEFEAAHRQKYKEPINFRQALWTEAGPSVGSMKIMLEMMRTKFEGELARLKADLTNYPQCLIDFLIKEAGEESANVILFLDLTLTQLTHYKEAVTKEKKPNEKSDALPPDKEVKLIEASKTQAQRPKRRDSQRNSDQKLRQN